MAGEDRPYIGWVKAQPCLAPGAPAGCSRGDARDAHHAGLRETGTGFREDRYGRQRPTRKAHDHTAIPLCHQHHVGDWEQASGPFKGWDKARRRAWQDEMIEQTRARFLARGELPEWA